MVYSKGWSFVVAALALAAGAAMAQQIVPNPLLAIDLNRTTVVDRVVADWGDALANSGAGLNPEQLRAILSGLRSDHLLAASLAGSLDGLRNVLANALTSTAEVKAGLIQAKALGDTNDDLVYTPLTPCRLVDTRGNGAPIQGGPFAPGERRTITPAGACSIPTSNMAALVLAFHTENLTTNSGGYISMVAPGAAVTGLVNVFNLATEWAATNAVVRTNSAGAFDVYVAQANPQVIIDVMGYFKPPSGTVQPSNILWVGQTGGNYTSVQAAINAAAAAASATNPYLVKIAPDLYTEQVTLKDFVDVEGSGQNATTIQFSAASPTVIAGAQSELRHLVVYNNHNAASPGANGIAQSGTTNLGTTLTDVEVIADGATDNIAVYVTGGFLVIRGTDVDAAFSGTQTGIEVGLWATGATSQVVVKNGSLRAESGTTRQSAHQESGALIKIENTQLKGTTFGTPLCFQTFVGSTYTAASCP